MSFTSYEASFWKRRLFYLKIAWFSWKVSEFLRFFENQKAPFLKNAFTLSTAWDKLTQTYRMALVYVPCMSNTIWAKRCLLPKSSKISKRAWFSKRHEKFDIFHENYTLFPKKGAFCLFEAFSWAFTDFKALKAPFLSDFTRLTRKYRRIVKCAFLNDQTCFPIILPKSPIWAWKSCTFWTFTWRF